MLECYICLRMPLVQTLPDPLADWFEREFQQWADAARRFSLREENSVLLISQHRNQVPRRVGCLRLEVEAGLVGRPIDGGSST
jgi:hypothetical protein